MSLGGALQIGRAALQTYQRAIEVTGHNLANVATVGYHRQRVELAPARAQEIAANQLVGRGVRIQAITRQADAALEGRIRNNLADQAFSAARRDLLSQIEALHNELSDADVSSSLNAFFNSWSELANNPQDNSLRTLVLRQADSLANLLRDIRGGLSDLRTQIDAAIDGAAAEADDLLTQIAALDKQIVASGGNEPGLLDTREALLTQLAEFFDVSVVEHPTGSADVYVGSIPVILNGQSRGIELRRSTVDGELQVDIVLKDDGSVLEATAGRIGALSLSREEDVNAAIDALDEFTNKFIFEINKIHTQGQGLSGFDSVTSTNRVTDLTAALNDAASGLGFTPVHGSFQLHLTQKSTGQRITTIINVDLDGINAASDTRLADLAAAIDASGNVNASVTGDGRLVIAADSNDFEVSFSNDTSGVLAALGINTFFAGSSADDIELNSVVDSNPLMIAVARDHLPGDNSNALAIAALRTQPLDSLNGLTINETWARQVEQFAVRLGQTNQQLEAETLVGENLAAQQQAISGVNADEETINLLAYQRAYQGSARFIQVIDELLEALLSLA